MRIVGEYSFNGGKEEVEGRYPELYKEVRDAIESVDAESCKTKESKEKRTYGQMFYNPDELNKRIEDYLLPLDWKPIKIQCEYPREFYVNGYLPRQIKNASREMDFVKQKLGVEIQFGKYSFMVYNVAAKMTIFRNLGHIDTGIEVVPIKELTEEMSSGVSYFEQFVWDLEKRGTGNIDVPTLILGIHI